MPKLVRTYCLLELLTTTYDPPLQAAMWMTKLDTDNKGSIEQVSPNHAVRTLPLTQSHTQP